MQAMIDALPDKVTEDNAEAVEQALTDIDDAKESLTEDELAGLDLMRYDAAANALSALLGEATTDAVELLDTTYTKPNLVDGYYQITNENDLRWFAQAVNGGKKSIKARLMNDITMDDTEWTPIGTERKPFEGIFDGNGKTITGLTYTDTSVNYVGLVGFADGATIQDVTVKDSEFNGNNYIGAVCGFIVDGYITGCTNSGSTVSGYRNIGGIVGRAKYTTVQRCVNTGKVTGKNDIGGIVGSTEVATVRDCGNTGEVRTIGIGKYYGGIAGAVPGSSNQIHNCYNAHSSTADKIYGDGSCYHSNCYYLANGSDSTDKEITAKTAEQFASGEVAFLLQGERTEAVWGQTLTGTKPETYPVLGGAKVYQTTPCTVGYSNTEGESREHTYADGVCSNCGASQPLEEVLVDGYYQIYTADQLREFADKVTSGNYNINARLMADIELNGTNKVLDDKGNLIADPSGLKEWTPIGTETDPFKGEFDGQGYTIHGLYIKSSENYVGLFGYVDTNGKVVNVTLADSYVSGGNFVGGICGANVGGTLQGCHNIGTVFGTFDCVGGVCGYNYRGTIQKCYNSGTVSGTNDVGGVCGENVSNPNRNNSTIQECYNTGKVSGTNRSVGGVCGWNNGSNSSNITIQECYNTGTVSGAYYVGGVCGKNDSGTVKNCYYLVGTSEKAVGGGNQGTNCVSKTELQFRNGEVAFLLQKPLDDAAPAGTTAEQVWGQTLTGENPDHYPVLGGAKVYQTTLCTAGYSNTQGESREHTYADGVCSNCGEHKPPEDVGGYYQITNQWQLRWFADKVNKGETDINAKLMNNITINSNVLNSDGTLNTVASANFTPWTLIGTNTSPFTGTFDGDNHTISGLYIAGTTDYVGLFGCVGNGGTVKNVTLADSYVSGNNYVGGICGQNKCGTLQNCHNTGKVSGSWYVGGVCGSNARPQRNDPPSTIQECYNTGTVSGKNYVGGVCGQNNRATVGKSYNTNTVSGGGSVGGVCGDNSNNGTVNGCYNTGNVSGTGFNVGGVCGYNSNTLENSFNTGDVSGDDKVGGVCGLNGGTVKNCYYLSDSDDTNARTEKQFASGEVAFLLQSNCAEPTWGQTLGTNASPVLVWQTDYKQVYHPASGTSPCPGGYSNNSDGTLNHKYDENGKCIYCGQPEIAYTVTIPASVELGNTATIAATGVTLPNGKELNVKVADGSEFKVALNGDTCVYTVTNKGDTANNPNGTSVTPGTTVLTAENGNKTVTLQFNKPKTTTYSGTYTGTVSFTVSVDDKPTS